MTRRILALATLAPLLAAACDAGSRAAEQIAVTEWDCDQPQPWVTIRADFMRDRTILEHEMIHVEQARALGCDEFNRRSRSAASYAELEQEAVCLAHFRTFGRPLPGRPECEGVTAVSAVAP
jgi:hypothetical protein